MPVDPSASVRISAFNWVPPFAQGHVRDLRPRWAFEEAGIPYAVRKLDASTGRPAEYYEEQPFGQVPSYHDEAVSLFESGAIVLHIGRDCDTLPKMRCQARPAFRAALAAQIADFEKREAVSA
jgi:glutathione S-transferase